MADLDVAVRLRLLNGLKDGSREARRDFEGIGKAAKGLGKARGVDNLSRDLEGAIVRAKRLERQLAALRSGRGMANLGTSMEGAAAGADRTARATARLARHLEKASSGAARLRTEYEGVASAAERAAKAGTAASRVAGRGGHSAGSNHPGRREGLPLGDAGVGAAGGLASRFGAGALGIGGGAYAAGALGKRVVTTYADLQTAAKALAITADVTDATVAKTVANFRAVGPALGATPKEMVEAAKSYVEAGLDYQTAVNAVVPSVKAARASFGELPDTAKAGVAAINNLEISVNDLPEAFDRMAKAGKEGNVELKNLARILPSVAAAGSTLGLKGLDGLTDIVSALEIVGKVTATPDEAANRLENLLSAAKAPETIKNFQKLGKEMGRTIDLEKEMEQGAAKGESKLAVLLRLTKELTKGNEFKIGELFGDRQANQAITALLKFEDEYNGIRGRIRSGSKGLVDQDFKRATDRMQADFERLGAAWDRLVGRIGEGLAPGVAAASKEMAGFLERLEQGDTIAQRLIARFTGIDPNAPPKELELPKVDGQNTAEEWFEKKFPWLSGKVWNEKLDEKIGKTNAEALEKFNQDRPPGRPLRMGVDPTAPIQGKPSAITPGTKSWQDAFPLSQQAQKSPLPPQRPAGLPTSGAASGIRSIEDVLGPKDLSAPATHSIDTYNQAIKAGLQRTEAEVKASAARMQASLSFTATPTISPRISAPLGGGGGGGSASPASANGASAGSSTKSASLARRGGGNTFNGPIHVHGVRDVASLQRGIQREADREARSARNDALHDTGNDFA